MKSQVLSRYRLLKHRFRRSVEKRLGGYTAQASTLVHYVFSNKRQPTKKFVIFCTQRSGSTLLVSLLNSHPMVECHGELLLNRMLFPRQHLDFQAAKSPLNAFGFKLQPHHFTYQKISAPDQFLKSMIESGYKMIKLTRRNWFESALSLQYAIASGIFHRSTAGKNDPPIRLKINPQALLEKIVWIEQNNQRLDQLSSPFDLLDLVYEDHLLDQHDHQSTLDLVFEWLEIPPAPVDTYLARTAALDYSQFIENLSELKSFIRGTKYTQFIS